jgi:hypothetical protein
LFGTCAPSPETVLDAPVVLALPRVLARVDEQVRPLLEHVCSRHVGCGRTRGSIICATEDNAA